MGKRVLILDDDADFNNLLTDIFSQADYDVTSEHDPEVAVDILQHTDFDLVVTDQKMPGLSGEEFIREVKSSKPEIPIIMVSGYLDNDTIRRLIKDGVGGVFLKPLNVFSLLKRTAALIEERESSVRRKSGQSGDDSSTALESEDFTHNLPFSFNSLPCKSPISQEFAKKLYSLRNFKTNLIVIAPSGSDLNAYLEDLREFSEPGQEFFHSIESYSLNQDNILSALIAAGRAGAARVTIIVHHAERMSPEQKKVIFSASGKESPFDSMTLPLRFIFHVPEDLDDLYDKGEIDDDLYMFMGTSEVKAPALNDIREDIPLMAQRLLNEACEKESISPAIAFDPPARVFLRDFDWRGNALELKRFIQAIIISGKNQVTRDDLQTIASEIRSSGQSKSFDIRYELENFRKDLFNAALLLSKQDTAVASQILGVEEDFFTQVTPKVAQGAN